MTARAPRTRSAFTLLELILSVSVLVALTAILVQVTSDVQRLWRRGADTSATAREAQIALDLLAADIAAAVARGTLSDGFPDAAGAEHYGPSVFAFAPDADTASPLTPADCASHFSYLLLTRRLPRPVWEETGAGAPDAGSAWVSTARTPPDDASPPLRSLLGVYYHVDPDAAPADDDPDATPSPSGIRYHLVRGTTGFPLSGDDADDGGADGLAWCRSPSDAGEIIAHNVAVFSITVPEFAVAETNGAYTVRTAYASRPDAPGGNGASVGPLPPLVDIVLGLVPERDMQQAEGLPESTHPSRQQFLERRVQVYTRRVRIR
jgi:type II secretory pathway component PulJ